MKIIVRADDLQVEAVLIRQQAIKLRRDVWAKLRSVSMAVERRVKEEMPVDTGRARASWGHWTPGDTNNPKSLPTDAEWNEDDEELTIEQGSNVEYVPRLNDGYSRQAPAGFIDAAEKHAQRVLDAEMDMLLARYF